MTKNGKEQKKEKLNDRKIKNKKNLNINSKQNQNSNQNQNHNTIKLSLQKFEEDFNIAAEMRIQGDSNGALILFNTILNNIICSASSSQYTSEVLKFVSEICDQITNIYVDKKIFDSAVRTLTSVIEWFRVGNFFPYLLYLRRAIAFRRLLLLLNAREDYRKAISILERLNPTERNIFHLVTAYFGKGEIEFELHNYSEAIKLLKLAKESDAILVAAINNMDQIKRIELEKDYSILKLQYAEISKKIQDYITLDNSILKEHDPAILLYQTGWKRLFFLEIQGSLQAFSDTIKLFKDHMDYYFQSVNKKRAEGILIFIFTKCVKCIEMNESKLTENEIKSFSILFLNMLSLKEKFSSEIFFLAVESWMFFLNHKKEDTLKLLKHIVDRIDLLLKEDFISSVISLLSKMSKSKDMIYRMKAYFYLAKFYSQEEVIDYDKTMLYISKYFNLVSNISELDEVESSAAFNIYWRCLNKVSEKKYTDLNFFKMHSSYIVKCFSMLRNRAHLEEDSVVIYFYMIDSEEKEGNWANVLNYFDELEKLPSIFGNQDSVLSVRIKKFKLYYKRALALLKQPTLDIEGYNKIIDYFEISLSAFDQCQPLLKEEKQKNRLTKTKKIMELKLLEIYQIKIETLIDMANGQRLVYPYESLFLYKQAKTEFLKNISKEELLSDYFVTNFELINTNMGEILLEEMSFYHAVEFLKDSLVSEKDAEIYKLLAKKYYESSQYEKALLYFLSVLDGLHSSFAKNELYMVYICCARSNFELKKYSDTLVYCQEAIKIDLTFPISEQASSPELFFLSFKALYNLGLEFVKDNKFEFAIQFLTYANNMAHPESKQYSSILLYRALCYYAIQAYDLAKKDLSLLPSQSAIVNFYLSLIALAENDLYLAERLIYKTVSLDLDFLKYYYDCANFYYKDKQYEHLIICLESGYNLCLVNEGWQKKFSNLYHRIIQMLQKVYYLYGISLSEAGTRSDKAIEYWTKASRMGSSRAQYVLALHYLHINENEIAFDLFKLASGGYHLAEYHLALCYLEGKGVWQDIENGYNFLKLAAQNGSLKARSYLKLHELYQNPLEEKNTPLEVVITQAENGDPHSQYIIAYYLEKGFGGYQIDLPKSLKWYERLASNRHIPAHIRLAKAFALGELNLKVDKCYAIGILREVLNFAEKNLEAHIWLNSLLLSESLDEFYVSHKKSNKNILPSFLKKHKKWNEAKNNLFKIISLDDMAQYLLGWTALCENEYQIAYQYLTLAASHGNLFGKLALISFNYKTSVKEIEAFSEYISKNKGGDALIYLEIANLYQNKVFDLYKRHNIFSNDLFEKARKNYEVAKNCKILGELSKLLIVLFKYDNINKRAEALLKELDDFYQSISLKYTMGASQCHFFDNKLLETSYPYAETPFYPIYVKDFGYFPHTIASNVACFFSHNLSRPSNVQPRFQNSSQEAENQDLYQINAQNIQYNS